MQPFNGRLPIARSFVNNCLRSKHESENYQMKQPGPASFLQRCHRQMPTISKRAMNDSWHRRSKIY